MAYRKLISTKDLTREDWLEQRRVGIGGSDVAGITGSTPWSTAYDVWNSKVKGIDKEFSPEAEERMYWGTVQEPLVCARFTELTGIKLVKCNYILQSEEYPFMLANVDRLVKGEKIGFEAKTTELIHADQWENDIPFYYNLQIQHYMAVTGFEAWYIAVKIGNSKFRWYKIERDEALIQNLIVIEKDFWENYVLTQIPPKLSVEDTEAIKQLYPKSNGNAIPLDSTAMDLIRAREELKAKKKELDNELEKVENGLKLMLGDNESGYVEDYNVIYKNSSRTSLDSTRIKTEAPDIFTQYSKTTEFRTLDVKKKK